MTRIDFTAALARFGICYSVLYCVYVLDAIGAVVSLEAFHRQLIPYPNPLFQWVVPPVARLFGVTITTMSNGSGDTTYDWFVVAINASIAVAAAILWSLLAKTHDAKKLYGTLRTLLSYLVAMMLLWYGSDKLIPLQFGQLDVTRLAAPVGSLSPMGMLWAFMAASPGYTMFTGSIEVLAGVLLLVPRTRTLGAFLGFAAMLNVFALNVFYDVPVKLLSFHLLVFNGAILCGDAKRIAAAFLSNHSPSPHPWRTWTPIAIGGAFLTLLLFLGFSTFQTRARQPKAGTFYGVWRAEQFALRGPNAKDARSDLWEEIAFDSDSRASVLIDGAIFYASVSVDASNSSMTLTAPSWRTTLVYRRPAPDELILTGDLAGRSLRGVFHRWNPADFRLRGSRFHLVSEHPN